MASSSSTPVAANGALVVPKVEEEVSEFAVRIPPRNSRKSHHVMKFNASLNIDFTKWAQGSVRMVRENNQKAAKAAAEADMPKFGAGSEFGREQKEEARRKKYGFNKKKYKPEDQPWLIRVGDKKTGKRYRGIREGGVAENTTYYVFTHAQDGAFEAHPISDWYNFTPILTYRTLNAEEAEEKFAERGKVLNHWALMVNKKIRSAQDDEEEMDEDGKSVKKSGGKKDNAFKISDMDDWVEEGDDLDTDSDDEKKKKNDSDDDKANSKKGKDAKKKKKRSKEDVQNEAFEDSDDGDDECREVDYMSDESSDSENEILEKADAKGVDQDHGLARMLDSESSSDEDETKKKTSDKEDEPKEENEEDNSNAASKKDKKKKKDKKGGGKGSSAGGAGAKDGKQSTNSSRSSSPVPGDKNSKAADKRKAIIENILDTGMEPAQKRSRLETFGSSGSGPPLSGSEAALEEDVRRYLTRKPMTTTELVKKIHSKRFQDLSSEELMPLLVNVLKKVNPHTSKTKGIMYLSLKPLK